MSLSFVSEPRFGENVLCFVLDAPVSMWQQIAGRRRIVVAKETFSSLIDQIPVQIQPRLRAYGYRRKGIYCTGTPA
jgi:hypothetical protein